MVRKTMKSAILFLVVLAASLVLLQAGAHSADAIKSVGTKTQQYGKHSQIQVCGTYFCTANPSLNGKVDPDKNKPTQDDLNAIFGRMDKINKQHQQQILQQWRLMENTDRIQFLQVMDQMLSDMESMDMSKHIQDMMNGSTDHGPMTHGYEKSMHDMKRGHMQDDSEDNSDAQNEDSEDSDK